MEYLIQITSLGHAGFMVELEKSVVIMDPWLSPFGAFDSSWFQYPRNHHMLSEVQDRLAVRDKEFYLYISHEHKDHFDEFTLNNIDTSQITFLIPKYRRTELLDRIQNFNSKSLILFEDGKSISLEGCTVTIFVDDQELNRDSGILLESDKSSFLNINDCKLYDRIPWILDRWGRPDVFSCQFSGASWHPVCYQYDEKEYRRISRSKKFSKFANVARVIAKVNPQYYLAAAGPPVFLDSNLMGINFQEDSPFPRAPEFLEYLNRYPKDDNIQCDELLPGEMLNRKSGVFKKDLDLRQRIESFQDYVYKYSKEYAEYFNRFQKENFPTDPDKLFSDLIQILEAKIENFSLNHRITRPLYLGTTEIENDWIRIDFFSKKIEKTEEIYDENYYSIKVPGWQLSRAVSGRITWEDMMLTFREIMNRKPDVYQTLVIGFVVMEVEDVNHLCNYLLGLEQRTDRIVVEAGGNLYSVDKYCPHQGSDLSEGEIREDRFLICPRHRWEYDLWTDGICISSNETINAVILEPDA